MDPSARDRASGGAKIVLLTAAGHGTNEIMQRTGKARTVIWRWQERFSSEGAAGLWRDKTRPSRMPPLDPAMRSANRPQAGVRPSGGNAPLGADEAQGPYRRKARLPTRAVAICPSTSTELIAVARVTQASADIWISYPRHIGKH